MNRPLLEVEHLTLEIPGPNHGTPLVSDAGLTLCPGRTLGLVGESGSGKSMLCKSILKLQPAKAVLSKESMVRFNGTALQTLGEKEMNQIRGREIAMVFQNPMSCLNPVMTIGDQVAEPLVHHLGMAPRQALEKANALLRSVDIPQPGRRIGQYPYQLSGGLRQRAAIAMAIACRPKLLIADEPTTALDVTVQAGILDLLARLQADTGMAILLVTHDLAVAAGLAHEIAVMHGGNIVETVPEEEIRTGNFPPCLDTAPFPCPPSRIVDNHPPLVQARDIRVSFPAGRGRTVEAVGGVSLSIARGETLGLVGESGCGKSSLANALMQLPGPTSGNVRFNGQNLSGLDKKALRELRPRFQMVFQDSLSALNPRRRAIDTLVRALGITGNTGKAQCLDQARDLMAAVGLDPALGPRRPHELSGGQCQRLQIARALATRPDLLVCDEPVSSLDAPVQAQILDLLNRMKQQHNLAMLFISHDLSVVRAVSDRVAVMYLGRICEAAPCKSLFKTPRHPYTQALLQAVPKLGTPASSGIVKAAKLPDIAGDDLPTSKGCRFQPRCPKAHDLCKSQNPELIEIHPNHHVACTQSDIVLTESNIR